MHVNELPEVILAGIFNWYCEPTSDMDIAEWQTEKWKLNLKLLSVCKLWRELAFPIVHRESFIYCIQAGENSNESFIDEPDNSDISDLNQTNSNDDQADINNFRSNLDILDSNGKCWPRLIKIYAYTSDDSNVMCQTILQKIRTHRHILDKVHTVMMNLESSKWFTDNSISDADARTLGKEFCQIMPLIEHLSIQTHPRIEDIDGFFMSVVSGYAQTLKSIECPYWALENVDNFSPRLTHFVMQDHQASIYIPKLCATSLEVLKLENVDNVSIWNPFSSKNNPGILDFSNLNTLMFTVGVEDSVDDEGNHVWLYPASEFKFKMVAPKLNKVTISLCPHTLSILSSIQGLSVIANMELAADNAIVYVTGFNLDRARWLFSRYPKRSNKLHEPVNMISYINDILSIDGLAEHTRVIYPFFEIGDEWGLVDWKYLNDLEIADPMKILKLPLLLSKVPSLETLTISVYELEYGDRNITDTIKMEATVEPIESAIKQLSIKRYCRASEDDINILEWYLRKLLPNSAVIVECL